METRVILAFFIVGAVAVLGYPYPEGPPHALPIPRPGKDGYNKDQYFQYINVPAHKVFEWGYRRGNPHHFREEYLSQKDHTFKAKVKWGDTHDGYGEHYFDYNHGPKNDYKQPHPEPYKPEPYKPDPYKPPVHH